MQNRQIDIAAEPLLAACEASKHVDRPRIRQYGKQRVARYSKDMVLLGPVHVKPY
jgi:hypothetical protein